MQKGIRIVLLIICLLFSGWSFLCAQDDFSDDDILGMFAEEMEEDPEYALLESIDDPELDVEITGVELHVHEAIDPLWIKSFLRFEEGMRLKLRELNALMEESIYQLKRDDHFYTVNIYLKTSMEDINKRTVVVEVSEGFWYGFSFYPVNFSLLFKHLFRAGKQLKLTAGLTEQSASYHDPALFYSPFYYSAAIAHTTSLEENEWYIEDKLRLALGGGINLSDEIALGADTEFLMLNFPQSYFYYGSYSSDLSASQARDLGVDTMATYLNFGLYNIYNFNRTEAGSSFGFEDILQGKYYHSLQDMFPSFFEVQNRMKFFFRPVPHLYMVLRNFSGYHTHNADPWLQYHLYNYENFRGIPRQEYGDHILTANADISLIELLQVQLGMFTVDFQPFLYFDAARLLQSGENWNLDGLDLATGGGVHIYVKPPVGIYFTFGVKNRCDPDHWKAEFLFEVSDAIY